MTTSVLQEKDVLKPLPPNLLRGDSNDWPIFVLEDVEIRSANTGKLASLFDAYQLNPVVIKGTISDVEKKDRKLLKISSWEGQQIEITDVTMYSFGLTLGDEDDDTNEGDDIGPYAIWASSQKSGWFEITKPTPSYQAQFRSMGEALSIWYYLVDNFDRHRQTKRSKADQMESFLQGYHRSPACKMQSKDKIKPALYHHRWFLMKSMHEGLDDRSWPESYLYSYFKTQHSPDFHRAGSAVRRVVDKPSTPAAYLQETGQVPASAAPVDAKEKKLDALFDSDAEAEVDDEVVAENTKANKAIIEKSETYRPHKRRKTVHEQEQLKSDTEESSAESDSDQDDDAGLFLSDTESKPRHAKSQLRPSTQASKTLGARHLQSPISKSQPPTPRARNESSSDSEAEIVQFRPSKLSAPQVTTDPPTVPSSAMEPNVSRPRKAPMAPMAPMTGRASVAPMLNPKPATAALTQHVPVASAFEIISTPQRDPRPQISLHPQSTVSTTVTSTWTCHFEGCNHKVHVEQPGTIERMANEHIRLEHLDALKGLIMEEGESYTREGQPWSGAENLMRKVKALEKNAKANGQKTTEGVIRMW